MKCKKIFKWIPLFITDDLEAEEKNKVENHIKECSLCQKLLLQYREDHQRILYLKGPSLSPRVFENYWEQIQIQLNKRENESEEANHRGKILLFNWGTRLALAASLLLALTLWGGKIWKKSPSSTLKVPYSPSLSRQNKPVFKATSSTVRKLRFFNPPFSHRGLRRGVPFFIPSRLPGKKQFRFELKNLDVKKGKILLFFSPKKQEKNKPQEQKQDGQNGSQQSGEMEF